MIEKYPKAHLLIPLSAPQPLLEQIFIERVPKSPHAGVLLTPLASFGVQVVRVQFLRPLHGGHHVSDLLHLLLVHRVASDVRQVGELHVKSAKLRKNAEDEE